MAKPARGLSVFVRYLTVWVVLCILGGTVLGRLAPGVAKFLDALAIYVGEAPVVSIPIAVCLFFMMAASGFFMGAPKMLWMALSAPSVRRSA